MTEHHDNTTQSPLEQDEIEEDLLVEEVSIDGMCGVY
jgi:mycofactocin precursor